MKEDILPSPNPLIPAAFIDFGREICGHLPAAERREWLVTNGIGGFAMGTVAGLLTRRYHGLLIAALNPPLGRTLLLTKFDETVTYNGRPYPIFANRWAEDLIVPAGGTINLERFHLEGTTPVWSFALGDALLEKRVWMRPGENTTYVRYHLQRANGPVQLAAKAIVNYRDYHHSSREDGWQMAVRPVEKGVQIVAYEGATPFYLLSSGASFEPKHEWYKNFYLSVEAYRGIEPEDDNLFVGTFQSTLQPGESLTLVASTEATPNLDGASAYTERLAYEQGLLERSPDTDHRAIRQLMLAADQFIVRRQTPTEADGRTIIAGYPWFSDWGRDTMIALPGLTLATGRAEVAAKILRTFAHFVDQGMLPNRFPDAGETPEYNTVDATLWYFQAIHAYYQATADTALLRELFPVLADIIVWHQRGTRYQIHVDPADHLLYAGEPGVQLTWMDAKVGDWVVTPRIGKPVEINALWYNALRLMADFARILEEEAGIRGLGDERENPKSQIPISNLQSPISNLQSPADYEALAEQVKQGFGRFWNEAAGYCYDVLDSQDGGGETLRPNQLFAVSLPYSPLAEWQQKGVVDACSRALLTSHGLRSLAADDPAYIGRYGGDQKQRDAAYHQGTVWGWLIGPFVAAHWRVYQDVEVARAYLRPLFHHLADHGLGSISEIFEGDPPFTPRGCPAQAWSVAEVLRIWQMIGNPGSKPCEGSWNQVPNLRKVEQQGYE
jgi:predicted glycogen debranching enzyme